MQDFAVHQWLPSQLEPEAVAGTLAAAIQSELAASTGKDFQVDPVQVRVTEHGPLHAAVCYPLERELFDAGWRMYRGEWTVPDDGPSLNTIRSRNL